jgi:hypothetical protein
LATYGFDEYGGRIHDLMGTPATLT